jgi:hypothetical protein
VRTVRMHRETVRLRLHSETLPCPAPPLLRRAGAGAVGGGGGGAAAAAAGEWRKGGRGGCRCMRAGGAGAPVRSLAAVVRLAAPSASVFVLLYQ